MAWGVFLILVTFDRLFVASQLEHETPRDPKPASAGHRWAPEAQSLTWLETELAISVGTALRAAGDPLCAPRRSH